MSLAGSNPKSDCYDSGTIPADPSQTSGVPVKRFIMIAGLVASAACTESSLTSDPTVSQHSAGTELSGLFSAARRLAPSSIPNGLRIGVLDSARTSTSALVSLYDGSELALYRFVMVSGMWQPTLLLEEKSAPRRPGRQSGAIQIEAYLSSIATTYNQFGGTIDSNWFINDVAATGNYTYWREYSQNLPYSSRFQEGAETSNDTTFAVTFDHWTYSRSSQPTGSGTCYTTLCNTTISGSPSERLVASYRLTVTPPVHVSISGPTSIAVAGSRTWTASATGGDGTYSFQWQRSADSINWTNVGTSSSYTEVVDTGSYRFYLRATASSAGKQGTTTISVSVQSNEYVLTASVSGPSSIETAGNYTWTASASGGTGTFSYSWYEKVEHYEACVYETEYQLVGTGSTYTRSVGMQDYDFRVKVEVTSGTQSVAATKKVVPFLNHDPYCPQRPAMRTSTIMPGN